MTETFRIPYPPTKAGQKAWSKRFSVNAYWGGKHWSKRKEDADFWHMLVRSEMTKQRVRRTPFQKPVIVTFYWNSRLDIDNNAIMGKMIVDAMKGRILQDDNRRFLRGVEHYFHDEEYIKVVVRTVNEEGAHGKTG